VGVFTFAIKPARLKKILLFFVSFSAGALFGDAFIHLLPEAAKELGFGLPFALSILAGILLFFGLEKFMHWRHCHIPTTKDHPHPFGMMNLIGDGLHNFIDGVLIAAAYMADSSIGIATTIAVLLHEVPQEIGDFGVLLHAGFSKAKALMANFVTALLALLGAVITLLIGAQNAAFIHLILPFAAGGFIYIAGADLIPELHKESESLPKSIFQFIWIILGIIVMIGLLYI